MHQLPKNPEDLELDVDIHLCRADLAVRVAVLVAMVPA